MRMKKLRIVIIVLGLILSLQSFIALGHSSPAVSIKSDLTPQPIRQGPLQTTYSLGSYYWFQIGAKGDTNTSSYNADGANITIRTVYDQVQNDAHSYWIGTLLSPTNGFVQVGYINGLSTTGQPYCCAWFFETFYNPSCDCPPTIGPEGSAGPIGSWHTYSMIHTGNGVWAFYMDNKLLGKSPPPGNANYLGSGATSSGGHAPAGIAEVAQAIDNSDVIGPAEFKNIQIHQGGTWQPMPAAKTYCCYGYSSQTNLPITYGIQEVEGKYNDFLAGSNIHKPPISPSTSIQLWPTSTTFLNQVTLTFLDANGGSFIPSWIGLQVQGTSNFVYYTNYTSQGIPATGSGTYTVSYVSWHGINVAKNTLISDSAPSQTIQGTVFSVPVHVIGRFYSLPVNGATVLTFLPDSTNETVKTDSEGNATFSQLPPGNYSLRITPPFGVPLVFKTSVAGPANLSITVFSMAELLTIIAPPIGFAILAVVLALRREQARRAAAPVTPPFPTMVPAAYCRACGEALAPTEYFCTTCGTPRAAAPQTPPNQPVSSASPAPQPPPPPSPQ